MIFDIDNPEGKVTEDSLLEDDSVIIDMIQKRKRELNNFKQVNQSMEYKWNRWSNRQDSNLFEYSAKIQYEISQLELLRESAEKDINDNIVGISDDSKKKIIEAIHKYNDYTIKEFDKILSSMAQIHTTGERIHNLIKLTSTSDSSPPFQPLEHPESVLQ